MVMSVLGLKYCTLYINFGDLGMKFVGKSKGRCKLSFGISQDVAGWPTRMNKMQYGEAVVLAARSRQKL